MRNIYIIADNLVSPLGATTRANFDALMAGRTGIRLFDRTDISPTPFFASLLAGDAFPHAAGLTRFEQLVFTSAKAALDESGIPVADPRTVFILSSTKGNIGLLEQGVTDPSAFSLMGSAEKISKALGLVNPPLVVSHACISGLQAMITAMRLLRAGAYDHAVVSGGDLVTRFILSGFQSFQAVSPEPCRPFDADRKGVTLGEAGATIVLSATRPSRIQLLGGAVTNDANHISGPSRTGAELALAISRALAGSGIQNTAVGFISAHGTATVYNDDMEARAMHLCGLQDVPLHSLKGYYGHTLGAAGLVESVMSIASLNENIILPTRGYHRPGTVEPVHVLSEPKAAPLRYFLKTASGFGGCNAAAVFGKDS